MLDFSLYHVILSQLPDKPNLAKVQGRHPLPEDWPVVLKHIQTFRGQLVYFTVTDGQSDVICYTSIPDLIDQVVSLELGTIIHLIGAEIRFSESHKCYVVDLQAICSLKAYDDRLKQQAEQEQKRIQWLKEQGYLEENSYEGHTGAETKIETEIEAVDVLVED